MNRLFSEKNATLQSAEIGLRLEDFSPGLGRVSICFGLYYQMFPLAQGPESPVITRPQLLRIIHTHHLSTHNLHVYSAASQVTNLLRMALDINNRGREEAPIVKL